MPNRHGPKEYGKHEYPYEGGTSDCKFGCGCWMGPTRSGGPLGLDPGGLCPGNPVDGKPLGGNQDYELVVNQRIQKLTSDLYEAKEELRKVSPDKVLLAKRLDAVQQRLHMQNSVLKNFVAGAEKLIVPVCDVCYRYKEFHDEKWVCPWCDLKCS